MSDWLIEHTEDLRIQLAGQRIPCGSGKQLGSLYVGSPSLTLDYLPKELLARVSNVADFARVLALHKGPATPMDGKQSTFVRRRAAVDTARHSFDQGYCFNAGEWTFPDHPLRGVFANNCVYESVRGWDAFEPALTRTEEIDADTIWRCAVDIPEEWYEGDRYGLHRLVEALYRRRCLIRRIISIFCELMRKPFPNRGKAPATFTSKTFSAGPEVQTIEKLDRLQPQEFQSR